MRESLILHKIKHPSIVKFYGINFHSFEDPTKLEPTLLTKKTLKLKIAILPFLYSMSKFGRQSFDQEYHSDIVDENDFENDDLVTFQHDSKIINLFYSQLTKYSKHIRESYLFSDIINRLPKEIHQFQEEFQISSENIDYFFQLSKQNYSINEDLILTYIQCIDLLKISNFLEVRKLSFKINEYIKTHSTDVDYIIQMIQYDAKTRTQKDNQQTGISTKMEKILSSKINECLSNEKFKELPIEIIYRILEKSSPDMINNNKLFDIIIKSLSQFCVLFTFVELQKLSNNRLSELYEIYSKTNENTRHYFDYLKCNLNLINEMNNRKKNLEEINEENLNKMKELDSKITSLQNQLKLSKKLNDEQQNTISELETKISSFQNQFNEAEKINNQLQKKFSDSEKVINNLQNQLNDSKNMNNNHKNKIKDLENQISQLQNKLASSEKQLKEFFIIKGNETVPIQPVDQNERLILFNGNSFNGIIHDLTNECGGNVHDKGKVLVSASSVNQENALPKFVADIDNLNSFFISKSEKNSWLEYDFVELNVRPTHYSIRSYPRPRNCYHPKSWVIEGSKENKNWVILDSQNDVDCLNDESAFHTFEIQKSQESNDYFRYLRFRQTGINAGSNNHFNFSALEFFGGIK